MRGPVAVQPTVSPGPSLSPDLDDITTIATVRPYCEDQKEAAIGGAGRVTTSAARLGLASRCLDRMDRSREGHPLTGPDRFSVAPSGRRHGSSARHQGFLVCIREYASCHWRSSSRSRARHSYLATKTGTRDEPAPHRPDSEYADHRPMFALATLEPGTSEFVGQRDANHPNAACPGGS